ncbi:hypothetical protein F5884DRAFT_529189 [Xylogone sp. PMI_703]|nr:hypothetical protein F5884DRAFT_529189 [Xylogone sp. PMI_703]
MKDLIVNRLNLMGLVYFSQICDFFGSTTGPLPCVPHSGTVLPLILSLGLDFVTFVRQPPPAGKFHLVVDSGQGTIETNTTLYASLDRWRRTFARSELGSGLPIMQLESSHGLGAHGLWCEALPHLSRPFPHSSSYHIIKQPRYLLFPRVKWLGRGRGQNEESEERCCTSLSHYLLHLKDALAHKGAVPNAMTAQHTWSDTILLQSCLSLAALNLCSSSCIWGVSRAAANRAHFSDLI